MSEWKEYKLGEVAEIQNGYAFKSSEFSKKGMPIIKIKNIVPPLIVLEDVQFFKEKICSRLQKFLVKKNDFLISMTGSTVNQMASAVGKMGRYKFEYPSLINQRVAKIYSKSILLNDDYLYYFLNRYDVQYDLALSASGSANQANISPEQLKAYKITLPNLEKQTAIAEILSSLDDKIELNNKINAELETLAQTLFKQWFVDFEFPGFDGLLVNGLPKGWRMGNILEITTLLSGGTPKTDIEEYWNGAINWISAKDITSSNSQFIIETEKTITELGIKKSATKLLPKFTTIISARGTVGNYCILSKEMAISQSNYGLKSNSGYDYYLFLMVENMILMMKAFSYGTVFDTITTKTFKEMEVIIPDEKIIKIFEKVITPLYEKILTNQFENQSLTTLRDTLLPKLISGEIEI